MSARLTTVVVVGAGPAGLATSRCLARRGVDHVVFERGEVGHSWRTERPDSLRLLTPGWMSRLPGDEPVDDPDGYLTAAEVVGRLERYQALTDAPIVGHTAVTGLRRAASGFVVDTDQGPWRCRVVVIATGASSAPRVPAVAAALPPDVRQVTALRYRNPEQVEPGGVLVVGGSASGVQIADELQRAGRTVTLAVGDHVRLPRSYRGRDIHWWMDAIGLLDERYDAVEDLARARRLPSPQLIGSPERRSLDLGTLHASGVEVTGRLAGVSAGKLQLSGSLANLTTSADLKLGRLLDRIDRHVAESRLAADPIERPPPTRLPTPATEVPLARIHTVVWATGNRPHHPWVDPALVDRRGRILHDGGVLDVPGLYVLGMPFTRRRSSTFIHGIGADAEELTDHLVGHLALRAPAA